MRWLMGNWGLRTPLLLGPLVLLLLGLGCSESTPAATRALSTQGAEQTAQTASYRISIRIGPTIEGEAMGPVATMAVTDQGQPVNRHLEIHIYDRSTGAKVKDVTPAVGFTDQATGASRGLANVLACLLAGLQPVPHYGDNLYLSGGTYTVTVGIGNETAVFERSL
jgi:hypothetical protein